MSRGATSAGRGRATRRAPRPRRPALGVPPLLLPPALAGHVLAVGGPDDERLRQWQRDREVVQTLVDGGLKLAAEPDPLKRAEHCNRMADGLAREIRQAGPEKQVSPAAGVSGPMQVLLG